MNGFRWWVKVHYNGWNSHGIEGGLWSQMISMHSYKDYFDRGIYGYTNGVKHPDNPTIVDHMIGTGPYKYVDFNAATDIGTMVKYENYWNKTALEAAGYFSADYVDIINFPTGEIGNDARNTAILTHVIDYAYDSQFMPLNLIEFQIFKYKYSPSKDPPPIIR